MKVRTEVARDERKAGDVRRKQGFCCVDCDRVTGAVNDVGEPQCQGCQKRVRAATAQAAAVCPSCGDPMLSEAAMCGFCLAELRATG